MPRRSTRALGALLGGALLAAGPAATPATAAGAVPLAPEIAAAQQQLAALNDRVDRADENYNAAVIDLGYARKAETAAQHAVSAARDRLAAVQQQVSRIAAAAYIGAPRAAMFTGGDADPLDYLRRTADLSHLARSENATLAQVALLSHDVAEQEAASAQATAHAQAIAEHLAAVKAEIQRDIVAQQGVLATLKARQLALERIAAAKARAARAAAERARRARAAAARRAAEEARRKAAAEAAAAAGAARQAQAAQEAGGGDGEGSAPAGPPPPEPPDNGSAAAIAVRAAYAQLGKPYQWAADGLDTFDCSGLTMYAYAQAGIALPHSAAAQYGYGTHVDRGNLQPGDLVFFGSPIHHVGIYVGNGQMIDAPHTGDVVRVQGIDRSDYAGATRLG